MGWYDLDSHFSFMDKESETQKLYYLYKVTQFNNRFMRKTQLCETEKYFYISYLHVNYKI